MGKLVNHSLASVKPAGRTPLGPPAGVERERERAKPDARAQCQSMHESFAVKR